MSRYSLAALSVGGVVSVLSRSPPYLIAKKLLLATSKLPSIASMKNIQCRRFDNLSRFVLRKAGLCLYTSPASNAKYLILFVLSQQILLTADNSLHQKFLSVCFRQNLRPARTHCQFLHVLPVYQCLQSALRGSAHFHGFWRYSVFS